MFKTNEAHFEGDYFFQNAALGTTTAERVSDVFELGVTEGGIRVRGWIEGTVACSSGKTITTKVQVGNDAASTAATDWEDIATKVVTATGTALTGELVSVIPDTDKQFMRVVVSNATSMTGNISVAVEYVPR